MNTTVKTLVFWLVILGSAMALWQVIKSQSPAGHVNEISYSEFMSQVNAGSVTKVAITGIRASGTYNNGTGFEVVLPASQDQMLKTLQEKGVEVRYTDTNNSFATWLMNLTPLILLVVLWFYMIRRMQHKKTSAAQTGPSSSSNTPWPQS